MWTEGGTEGERQKRAAESVSNVALTAESAELVPRDWARGGQGGPGGRGRGRAGKGREGGREGGMGGRGDWQKEESDATGLHKARKGKNINLRIRPALGRVSTRPSQ